MNVMLLGNCDRSPLRWPCHKQWQACDCCNIRPESCISTVNTVLHALCCMLSAVHAASKLLLLCLAQLQSTGDAICCHHISLVKQHCWSCLSCNEVQYCIPTNICSQGCSGQAPAKNGGLHCRCLAQHRLESVSIVMIVIILCKLLV